MALLVRGRRSRPPRRPPSRLAPVWRGLVGRCGWCGGRGIFASLSELKPRCPTCGLRYEREDGYWLGAMTVSIGAVIAAFGAWFVGGMLLFWPDVPWTGLLVGGLLINGAIPLFGYGWSKAAWVGIDLAIHPPEPHEQADAMTATEAARREPSGDELDDRPDRGTGESGGCRCALASGPSRSRPEDSLPCRCPRTRSATSPCWRAWR